MTVKAKALRASGGGGSRLLNPSEGMGEAKETKRLVKLKGTTPYNLLCLARLLKSDAALEAKWRWSDLAAIILVVSLDTQHLQIQYSQLCI